MANTQWQAILTEVLGAFFTHKLAFVVDDIAVSISDVTGGPVKFDLATAIFAAENIFLGSTGELQVGNILISIGRLPPTGSNATPAAAAIAEAIAATIVPTGSAVLGSAPQLVPSVVATGPLIVPIGAAVLGSAPQPVPSVVAASAPAEPVGYIVHAVPH